MDLVSGGLEKYFQPNPEEAGKMPGSLNPLIQQAMPTMSSFLYDCPQDTCCSLQNVASYGP